MYTNWLADDLHVKGLEGDTTKYLDYVPMGAERETLLAAFYPDGTVRIICEMPNIMTYLEVRDGYLYFTNDLLNNGYCLHRINLNIPKEQPFKIENLGEKGYLYGLGDNGDGENIFDFKEDGIYSYGESNDAPFFSWTMYKIFYNGIGHEKVGPTKTTNPSN
ncbi:MAG: hypothetical protein FWC60_03605 [Firmicutes bacterium]|nr:hypothetical protein [Bacillota bacterium]